MRGQNGSGTRHETNPLSGERREERGEREEKGEQSRPRANYRQAMNCKLGKAANNRETHQSIRNTASKWRRTERRAGRRRRKRRNPIMPTESNSEVRLTRELPPVVSPLLGGEGGRAQRRRPSDGAFPLSLSSLNNLCVP